MFILPYDRARVRIEFDFEGRVFKPGEWITGSLVWAGGSLRFQTDDLVLVLPDNFDRFDIDGMTLTETLGMDIGRAEDREEDDEWQDSDESDDVWD